MRTPPFVLNILILPLVLFYSITGTCLAQRVYQDLLSLLRYLHSSRSLFFCVLDCPARLFSHGKKKRTSRKKNRSILFLLRLGRLSFDFLHRLVEKSFALSVLIFPFCLFRFVCVRVFEARHRGRARRRRGCQRVLSGRGGVARSAVDVFVARRRVCLETQGKHEWDLSGLQLKN